MQIGKHFGLVTDILNEKELDQLYSSESFGLVGGEHQGKSNDPTKGVMDAISGSDWFEYRKVPKKFLTKIRSGYADKLSTEKEQKKSYYGFWNDAKTLHSFYKDVVGFIDEHKNHKIAWQDNGHFFGSRRLQTYHFGNNLKSKEKEK